MMGPLSLNKTGCWFALSVVFFCGGCGSGQQTAVDVSMYQYRDTRNLVQFVYDAAQRLQRDGDAALESFRGNRARYRTEDYYLYVYDMNGVSLFHAGMPELEGQDLSHVTDKNGRSIHVLALEALDDPQNPHGWTHYSWWEPDRFYPVPKSSCHFQATLDDGRKVLVGGGLNYPHEESEFIRILVDSAGALLAEKGLAALAEIANPVSKFCFRDVRVFVFKGDGELLISPAIGSVAQTGLLDCVDEAGHTPFAKAMQELENADSTWGVFMARNHYRRELVKKALYIRKIKINAEQFHAAAITDLPLPPY